MIVRMPDIPAHAPLRIARPTRDMAAAERFWVEGVGLDVQWRTANPTGEGDRLLMVGLPGASWHLEILNDPASAAMHPPGPEDLLVVYLNGPVPAALVERVTSAGGIRTAARNPYWDRYGISFRDPDGYLFVLCERDWRPGYLSNASGRGPALNDGAPGGISPTGARDESPS